LTAVAAIKLPRPQLYEVEQMKLQQDVFSLKRLSMVFLVVIVCLSLATLGTSFAAATLAKDTDVKDGTLVKKNGGGTVATSKAAKTFIVAEGATPSTGRRTQASGVLTILRVDADTAFDICDTTNIRLERSCTIDGDFSTIEISICPSPIGEVKTVNKTNGDVVYTFAQASGNVIFTCPADLTPCTVAFPATAPAVCSVTQVVGNTPVVPLGSASNYAILAKTAISTVPTSVITGDIAVSPAAATFMTGFTLSLDAGELFSTDVSNPKQVTGSAFADSYGGATKEDLTTAVGYMETAYDDAYGRTNSNDARINLGQGLLGGVLPGGPLAPLTAGVYTFDAAVSLKGNIHFQGTEDDIFIIQIAENLSQAGSYTVILDTTNGQKPNSKNIFWAVMGAVEVGAGAHMKGIILGKTTVAFITGSSLEGRVLTQTACTLQMTAITAPANGVGE
jgi:hypothetical protein